MELHQPAEALRWYQEALSWATGYEIRYSLSLDLAIVYKDLGETKQAESGFKSLLATARERGEKGDEAVVLNNLGEVATRMGQLDIEEDYYEEAMKLATNLSKTTSVYYARGSIAFLKRIREDYASAVQLFEEAAQYFEKSGFVRNAGIAKAEQAFCLVKLGRFGKAEELLTGLVKNGQKFLRGRAYTLGAMLEAESSGSVAGTTLEKFNQGIELLRESGKEDDLAFDLLYFGELEIKHGRVQEGLAKVREAKEIYERIKDLSEMKKIEGILREYGEEGKELSRHQKAKRGGKRKNADLE